MTKPNDPDLLDRAIRFAEAAIEYDGGRGITTDSGSLRETVKNAFMAGSDYQRGRMQTLTDMTALYEQSEEELTKQAELIARVNARIESLERRNTLLARTSEVITDQRDHALKQYTEARAAARQGFGHSNCYCERCKLVSERYWEPLISDTRKP